MVGRCRPPLRSPTRCARRETSSPGVIQPSPSTSPGPCRAASSSWVNRPLASASLSKLGSPPRLLASTTAPVVRARSAVTRRSRSRASHSAARPAAVNFVRLRRPRAPEMARPAPVGASSSSTPDSQVSRMIRRRRARQPCSASTTADHGIAPAPGSAAEAPTGSRCHIGWGWRSHRPWPAR